jgi:hypothetical protein
MEDEVEVMGEVSLGREKAKKIAIEREIVDVLPELVAS